MPLPHSTVKMKLYFLRHGIAEDHRPGHPDAERRLTAEGREEMRGVARGIRTLGLEFDAILTSPLVRARETAEFVAEALDAKKALRKEPRLAGCDMGDLAALLEGQASKAKILLVGHEPDFSSLIGALTGGRVRVAKASLACVACERVAPGAGELRWFLKPDHLCLIGL